MGQDRGAAIRGKTALAWALLMAAGVLAGCLDHPGPNVPSAGAPAVAWRGLEVDTQMGSFTAILFPQAAPRTVALVGELANSSYYAGRGFVRVVPGHVIQESDPSGGFADDPRTLPLETDPSLHFSAGALGIARAADPNSGGPEFFVMDFATSHLDGNYTVFGQVVRGMNVVHAIARVPAIDAPRVPASVPLVGGAVAGTTDRMAVPPVTITGARLVIVLLSAADAAHYPLQVARDQRHGDARESLEWPNDLQAGAAAELTWYVRMYNGTSLPAGDAVVHVDGQALAAHPDGDAAGAYHFTWTPAGPGRHNLELDLGSRVEGRLDVVV